MNRTIKLLLCLAIIVIVLVVNAKAAVTVAYFFNMSSNASYSANDILRSSSVSLHLVTDRSATCRYSQTSGLPYGAMEGVFDADFETIHKKYFTNLNDGTYKYSIKCLDTLGVQSGELTFSFAVSPPISADISFSKTPPFSEGRVKVNVLTTKEPSQTPAVVYSFDGISYHPLPLAGSGKEWFGYIFIPSSIGEVVGSFKFSARDMEGVLGEEVRSGKIFLVDTTPPEIISSIEAIGKDGSVELDWEYPYDFSKFKIYRDVSPGVDYNDYYASILTTSYIDDGADRGKTYYYRVSALDDAGNEAALSREIYTAALLQDSSANVANTGLSAELRGSVDSLIADVRYMKDSIQEAKQNLIQNSQDELFTDLKLDREFQSASLELDTLEREVTNYRTQDLNKIELDKKINAAGLKLSTIKKKIPEQIMVLDSKDASKSSEESKLNNLYLEINPEMQNSLVEKAIEISLDKIITTRFNVNMAAYQISIVYLDGTKKDITLIKEEISSSMDDNENYSIFEYIPKDVAEKADKIDVKNAEYDLVKDDPIYSFPANTQEISYTLEEHVSLDSLQNIHTLLVYTNAKEGDQKSSLLTGLSILGENGLGKHITFSILGIVIVSVFVFYLFVIRMKQRSIETLSKMKEKLVEARKHLNEDKPELSAKQYQELKDHYKSLSQREKEGIYGYLQEFYKDLREKQGDS